MNQDTPPRTSITQLRNAPWDVLQEDVTTRISLLKELVFQLEPGPLNDKIANDLILPAIATLARFIKSVGIDGDLMDESEDESEDEPEDEPEDVRLEIAAKAACDTLTRENERLRDKCAAAANEAMLKSTEVMLLNQDLETIREIITKGGSAADVLKFLDTPESSSE
jgi:CO dehydrogenase/acetyl-CoA synthase beta subunit